MPLCAACVFYTLLSSCRIETETETLLWMTSRLLVSVALMALADGKVSTKKNKSIILHFKIKALFIYWFKRSVFTANVRLYDVTTFSRSHLCCGWCTMFSLTQADKSHLEKLKRKSFHAAFLSRRTLSREFINFDLFEAKNKKRRKSQRGVAEYYALV